MNRRIKLGSLLWRTGLVLAIGAGAAQYWLVQRTHEEAARFAARLVPYGELRYEKLLPFPWGAGRAWGVSFKPEGMLSLSLQTPPGLRINVRELRIDAMRRGADGIIEHLDGRMIGVQIPVAEMRAPKPVGPDPAKHAKPTLFDLGYEQLEFDLDFRIQYVAQANLAMLQFNAAGPDLGRAYLSTQLEGSPRTFERVQDQILVRRVELEFADGGLLTRYKDVAAARARLSRTDWEAAMVESLEQRSRAEKWKWDPGSARDVRRAIRDSTYFRALIDPPSDVALRNVRLYPVADWPPLLGFKFSTEGGFEHSQPGAPSR